MHCSLDSETILTDHAVCVGIIYMNWNPMLMSISHNVKFGTVEAIQKSKSATLVKFIKSIIQLYKISGFQVTTALMDGEFGHLWDELAKMGVTLNSMSCSGHVGEIKRYILTIKEQMRAIYNILPFKNIPTMLTIEIKKSSVLWLNRFPPARGVSEDPSSRTIITSQKLDYSNHCKFQICKYVQMHEEHDNLMNLILLGHWHCDPQEMVKGDNIS